MIRWEGCDDFHQLHAGVAAYVADDLQNRRDFFPHVTDLEDARIIKVDALQLAEIRDQLHKQEPLSYEQFKDFRPPFDSTFVLFDKPFIHKAGIVGFSVCARDYGFCISAAMSGTKDAPPFVVADMLIDTRLEKVETTLALITDYSDEGELDMRLPQWDDLREDIEELIGWSCTLTLALSALLRSTNVELSEEPVSRQVRRNAARKNRKIPLTIHVKRGSSGSSDARGGTKDFSHQWDVMGHFRYTTCGPKFDSCPSDKLVRKPGTDVLAVREWVRPYVKGPETKPYIPKVRILDEETVAA